LSMRISSKPSGRKFKKVKLKNSKSRV